MSRHSAGDHTDPDQRLTVLVTPKSSSRLCLMRGRPLLVIDYGGYELAFQAEELGVASEFGIGLAFAALGFSSRCRSLMDGRQVGHVDPGTLA
jgi:hypothetical protein